MLSHSNSMKIISNILINYFLHKILRRDDKYLVRQINSHWRFVHQSILNYEDLQIFHTITYLYNFSTGLFTSPFNGILAPQLLPCQSSSPAALFSGMFQYWLEGHVPCSLIKHCCQRICHQIEWDPIEACITYTELSTSD